VSNGQPVTTGTVTVLDLFETHLIVSDLDRSVAFYRDIVGLLPALEEPPRGAAFLWIGRPGEAMLGLWSLESAPLGVTSHVAFTASLNDVLGACERLQSLNVTPLSFFASETEEPSVIGWMPAAAVYFRDPDGHLLEYLAMLDSPPDPDAGILPWSQWTQRAEPSTPRPLALASSRTPVRAASYSPSSLWPRTPTISSTTTSTPAKYSSRRTGSGSWGTCNSSTPPTERKARSRTWQWSLLIVAAESAVP
jgi:lactoylglutathione lyase